MHRRVVALAVLSLLVPAVGSAQDRLVSPASTAPHPSPRRPTGPVVTVAPVTIGDEDDEASLVAIQRASERIVERFRPLEDRLRGDDRVRRAGAVVGLGAIVVGAMRGTAPLTFAGTQALRLGLHRQLTVIERRSGFVVEPSIGHRSITVSVNKVFR